VLLGGAATWAGPRRTSTGDRAAPDLRRRHGNSATSLRAGRYTEAVKRYEEALARAELPEVHVELALTWCELGRFDRAREHYRRAMEIGRGRGGGAVKAGCANPPPPFRKGGGPMIVHS